MGFFDRISDALNSENREKKENWKKGKDLYYHNQSAGIKLMEENSRTAEDYRITAAKQWQKVKDEKKSEDAAWKDPDYQRLMELSARAPY